MVNRDRHKNTEKLLVLNERAIQELISDATFKINPIRMQHEDVRIVIFVATKLCFDTATVKEVDLKGKPQFSGKMQDINLITKLLFGDSNANVETGIFKVYHSVAGQLMISRLFAVPRPKSRIDRHVNFNQDAEPDVQMWGACSSTGGTELGSCFNTDPPEYLRHLDDKSLELSKVLRMTKSSSISSHYSRKLTSSLKLYSRHRYIGVAMLFQPKYFDFLFTHLSQLDHEYNSLQVGLFKAFMGDTAELHTNMYTCCRIFRVNMASFHNAMRLSRFATTLTPDERFLRDFIDLINIFENKERGYFLSKLLSAVLMYHLTWVLTTESSLANTNYGDYSSEPMLIALGCVEQLSHTTRIVVSGNTVPILAKILNVLSFFVRVEGKRRMVTGNADSGSFNHYDVNNLWPFSTTEKKTKFNENLRKFSDMSDKTLVKVQINMNRNADRWQLGKLNATLAQKQVMNENLKRSKWKLKYMKVPKSSKPKYPSQRVRTRSAPQLCNFKRVVAIRSRTNSDPLYFLPDYNQKFSLILQKFKQGIVGSSLKKQLDSIKNVLTSDEKAIHEPKTTNYPDLFVGEVLQNGVFKPVAVDSSAFETPKVIAVNNPACSQNFDEPSSAPKQIRIASTGHISTDLSWPWISVKAKISTSDISKVNDKARTELKPKNILAHPRPCHFADCNDITNIPRKRLRAVTDSISLLPKIENQVSIIKRRSQSNIERIAQPKKLVSPKRRWQIDHLVRKLANTQIGFIQSRKPTRDEKDDIFKRVFSRYRFIEKTMDSYADILNQKKDVSIHNKITSNFFGGICDSFFPGFIMQAIDSNKLSAAQLEQCIKREVQYSMSKRFAKVESKVISEREKQEENYLHLTSVIINADIDAVKTMIYYGDQSIQSEEMVYPCNLIQSMIERVKSIHSDAILTIQDVHNSIWCTLENIVRKSIQLQHFMQSQNTLIETMFNSVLSNVGDIGNKQFLNEIRNSHLNGNTNATPKAEKVTATELVKLLDCEYSDLRLLINVCSVTSPSIRGTMGF